jgi:hypothetical protein
MTGQHFFDDFASIHQNLVDKSSFINKELMNHHWRKNRAQFYRFFQKYRNNTEAVSEIKGEFYENRRKFKNIRVLPTFDKFLKPSFF